MIKTNTKIWLAIAGILLIVLGHNLFVTVSLPVIFAWWVLIEGIIVAVQSFDYKQAGFSAWWASAVSTVWKSM